MILLLPISKITTAYSRGKSSIYSDIHAGLFPRPVKVGAKSSRWPNHEVEALIRAHIEGYSEEQIRQLVAELEANRIQK